jgi:hypothetical protein
LERLLKFIAKKGCRMNLPNRGAILPRKGVLHEPFFYEMVSNTGRL